MNILVIGGAGRTGRHVVREGSRRGHEIHAFTRRPSALAEAGVGVIEGDGLDPDAVRRAIVGRDAVISIVANETLELSTTTSDVTRNVVRAMEELGVRRLVVTSSRSITASRPRIPVALTWLVLRHAYVDLVRAETIVAESALEWTIARATRLVDGKPKGCVHVDREANATGGSIDLDRADYALALLDTVEDASLARCAIGINGPRGRSAS